MRHSGLSHWGICWRTGELNVDERRDRSKAADLPRRRPRPTRNALEPGTVAVKTYRDILTSYRTHPEQKSLGPDREPCRRSTTGLLRRRPVQAVAIAHIGKEANLLDQIAAGASATSDALRRVACDRNPARCPRSERPSSTNQALLAA